MSHLAYLRANLGRRALKLPFTLEADMLIKYAKENAYIRQSRYMTR